jgi:methylase of polypeptide subunit release factors
LYEKLIYQIFELESIYNIKNIILFIEIGFDQKEVAQKFLEKQNLNFEIFKDNGGINRCIKIYF